MQELDTSRTSGWNGTGGETRSGCTRRKYSAFSTLASRIVRFSARGGELGVRFARHENYTRRVYSLWRCLNRIKKARAKGHRNCRHSQVCASHYTGVFGKENKFEINRLHVSSLVVAPVCARENVKRDNRIAFYNYWNVIETLSFIVCILLKHFELRWSEYFKPKDMEENFQIRRAIIYFAWILEI